MSQYVDLGRLFFEHTEYAEHERSYAAMLGHHLSLTQVLTKRFVVVVAPANYGKTTELSEAAERLRMAGEAAIFTKLKNVRSASEEKAAFDDPSWRALERWRESGATATLSIFLDSLDEADLSEPIDLLNGLRRLGTWVKWPNESVRWVISTRPAVLTSENQAVTESFLKRNFKIAAQGTTTTLAQEANAVSQTVEASTSEPVHIFGMLPLQPAQAVRYLVDARKISSAQEILLAARIHGLGTFTESPGGLDILARIDLLNNPPAALQDVFERVIEAVTHMHRSSGAEISGRPDSAELHRTTEALALACTMCLRTNILLPQNIIDDPVGALSARRAASYISDQALRYLLGSQLFLDTGQEQVKIYPEQLLPFMAAKRLSSLIKTPDDAQRVVGAITWSAPTGETGVARHLLALAGWLATLNDLCRDALIQRDPQAAAFFGDLRSPMFPVAAARTALTRAIERIATDDDRIGREVFSLTNENYWQAAAPALETTIVELYREYGQVPAANRLLLNIAKHSRLNGLRPVILQAHKNSYVSLLSSASETTYLLELGVPEDLVELSLAFVAGHAPNESLAAALLDRLAWSHLGARQIASAVRLRLSRGAQEYRISYTLRSKVLERASVRQIADLIQVMFRHLLRDCRPHWKSKRYLPELGQQIYEFMLEALAAAIARAGTNEILRLAMLAGRVLRLGEITHQHDNDRKLQKALDARDDVRQTLIREVVRRGAARASDVQRALFYGPYVIPVKAADVQAIDAPALTQAFGEQQRWTSDDTKAERRAQKSQPEPIVKPIDEKSKAALTEQIESIRNGINGGALAWLAMWQVNHTHNNRYGEVEPAWLIAGAGEEIASAALAGLKKFWRAQRPMFDQDKPNSIYHHTVAGLQALHLELGDGSRIPDTLTAEEIDHALAFGFFEINGFPTWFFPLVEKHPVEAARVLTETVKHAADGKLSTQHAEHLLTYFEKLPLQVRTKLESTVWDFLLGKPDISSTAIGSTLSILRCSEREIDAQQLRDLLEHYLGQLAGGPEKMGVTPDASSSGVLSAWAGYWLSRDPTGFSTWITGKANTQPELAQRFIYEFAIYLGDERRDDRESLVTSNAGLTALNALYLLVARVVAYEEDPVQLEMVVYASGGRQYAERLREQLLNLIGRIDSEAAYAALERIRRETRHAFTRTRIRWLQFDMQERRYAPAILSPPAFADFEKNLTLPFSDDRGFAAAIHRDLLAVKYQVENGEFSLRRFFSKVAYATTASLKGRLALERDFQRLLGREMEFASTGRYSVFSEPVLPEDTRRDIALARGGLRGTIELKMSLRWSIAHYEEALKGQLVDKYMRNRNANIGFLVIVLQKPRTWRHNGRTIAFGQLLNHLSQRASLIMQSRSGMYLRVIGIDATEPERSGVRTLRPKTRRARGRVKRRSRR